MLHYNWYLSAWCTKGLSEDSVYFDQSVKHGGTYALT